MCDKQLWKVMQHKYHDPGIKAVIKQDENVENAVAFVRIAGTKLIFLNANQPQLVSSICLIHEMFNRM